MKKIIFSFSSFAAVAAWAQKAYCLMRATDFTQVTLTDVFWLPLLQTDATVTIPASFAHCENTYRFYNFVMAAKAKCRF